MNPIEHLQENTLQYLNKWTRPSDWGGTEWRNHYVFLSQSRDSDALSRSNFECATKAMEEIGPEFAGALNWGDDSSDVEPWTIVREGHWACGWVEWIAIHKDATKHLECAAEIACALEDYPVVNEEHFSEVETTEANEVWQDCYSVEDRVKFIRENPHQCEFNDWVDLMQCVRGNYFVGYASDLLH